MRIISNIPASLSNAYTNSAKFLAKGIEKYPVPAPRSTIVSACLIGRIFNSSSGGRSPRLAGLSRNSRLFAVFFLCSQWDSSFFIHISVSPLLVAIERSYITLTLAFHLPFLSDAHLLYRLPRVCYL